MSSAPPTASQSLVPSLFPSFKMRSIGSISPIWSATAMQYCLSLHPSSTFPWPMQEGAVQTSTRALCLPWGSWRNRDSEYRPTVRSENSAEEGILVLNSTDIVMVGHQLRTKSAFCIELVVLHSGLCSLLHRSGVCGFTIW